MYKTIHLFGILSVSIIGLGSLLKITGLPGGGLLLLLSQAFLMVGPSLKHHLGKGVALLRKYAPLK